jgi:Rieske Fe-S protein
MNTRRFFIATWLALAGFGRRARAQVAGAPIKYATLTRPVSIPTQAVVTPWRPVTFVAEAMAAATPRAQPRRVLISGVLFRRGNATGAVDAPVSLDELSALCVTCPHEQCQVDLVTDQAQLGQMVRGTATHPLFECGCHLSVFDAAEDGARISGETPRGLYRFRIGAITGDTVEITEIEDVALYEV